MRRLLAIVLCGACACVPMQEEVRVERGPLLRTYEREQALGNRTLQAEVLPRWPDLDIRIQRFDTCRTEKVEEYAEDHITERTSRGVGPALTLGICGTLVGGSLLVARNAFSNDPNKDVIDGAGHYGPSPRQVATGWGAAALTAGIPALAVALIDLARSGETSETVKADQVVSARDNLCQPQPVSGNVEMLGAPGPRAYPLQNGVLTLNPDQLRELGEVTMSLNGEPVFIARAEDEKLNAFRACVRVLPVPKDDQLGLLSAGQLHTRLDLVSACARVAPEAAEEAMRAYDGALKGVEQRERPQSSVPGPRIESWDEAVEQLQPKRHLAEGTADALAFSRNELPADEPVTVTGRVRTRTLLPFALISRSNGFDFVRLLNGVDPNTLGPVVEKRDVDVAVIMLGKQEVLAILAPGAVWDTAVRGGAQLDLVGVVRTVKDSDGKPLSLIEVSWARSAQ